MLGVVLSCFIVFFFLKKNIFGVVLSCFIVFFEYVGCCFIVFYSVFLNVVLVSF